MKKILAPLLVLLVAIPCLSQPQSQFNKYKIEWSTVAKQIREVGYITDVFGKDDEGFYTLSSWSSRNYNPRLSNTGRVPSIRVDYYANNLISVNSKKVDFKAMDEKRNLESFFQMRDGRFYMFTSYLNRDRENVLEAQLMRPQTLQFSSNQKEIHRLSFEGYAKNNSGTYGFNMSPDSTKLLVFYNLPYERSAEEKFGFKVYDQFLKPIWEKEITLPYTDELFKLRQLRLDNAGNLYVIGKVFRGRVR